MKAKCQREGCGYEGHPDTFGGCMTPYHDLRCPKCGTTNVDTSEILKEDPIYGYGENNCLKMPGTGGAPGGS